MKIHHINSLSEGMALYSNCKQNDVNSCAALNLLKYRAWQKPELRLRVLGCPWLGGATIWD